MCKKSADIIKEKLSLQSEITTDMIHLLPLQLPAFLTDRRNDTQDTVPSNNQNQIYEETKEYFHSRRCPEKVGIPIQKCMCSYSHNEKQVWFWGEMHRLFLQEEQKKYKSKSCQKSNLFQHCLLKIGHLIQLSSHCSIQITWCCLKHCPGFLCVC